MDEFRLLEAEKEQSILTMANVQDATQIMSGPIQQPLDMQQDINLNANQIQCYACFPHDKSTKESIPYFCE